MPETVNDNQQVLVEAYGLIENRQERLGAVVDAARDLARLPDEDRHEANLVPGCTSQVWLRATHTEGRCRFEADCDSPLVRGLVNLICQCYDRTTPADAAASEVTVLEELGFLRDLSPTRQNGLAAVQQRIRAHARSWC